MPAKRRTASPPAGAPPKARPSQTRKREQHHRGRGERDQRSLRSVYAEDQGREGEDNTNCRRQENYDRAQHPPLTTEVPEHIEILDPDSALYSSFVAICALKSHSRTRTSDAHAQEVDDAFNLFTFGSKGGTQGGERKITMGMLKMVAKQLKEDVSEEVLRDMLLEANGGAGVGQGVGRDEFEEVMRRAGVWR